MSDKIPVDSGQVIVVDPAYLFTSDEWAKMPSRTGAALFAALKQKLGVDFCKGALVGTGGDGTFTATPSERGVPIRIESTLVRKPLLMASLS